ncbi:MAG TPA: hypothetical protein VFQ54_07395 [Thermomicrobiales bacterium]|nr:hypothetical protein [Thermomicrobiales bacterium]
MIVFWKSRREPVGPLAHIPAAETTSSPQSAGTIDRARMTQPLTLHQQQRLLDAAREIDRAVNVFTVNELRKVLEDIDDESSYWREGYRLFACHDLGMRGGEDPRDERLVREEWEGLGPDSQREYCEAARFFRQDLS